MTMSCIHQLRRLSAGLPSALITTPSKLKHAHCDPKIPSIQYHHLLRRLNSNQSQNTHVPKISSNHRHKGGNSPPPYILWGVILPTAGLTVTCIYAYNSCLECVPCTNRKRFIVTSPEWEARTGHDQYRSYLNVFGNNILPKDHRATVTVARVGSRIAEAAKVFNREYHGTNPNTSLPFTYTVVRSDDANAFVLPGNHVFVMTGLFRYVHNEDELASILGHEIAHNLARHAGERVSQNFIVKMLSYLMLVIDPSGMLFNFFVPAEALFYSLPHSREHEIEADEIGFILSSEACYDPRSAKKVFARMKHNADCGDKSTATPPEFISTHPGYETRLSNFDEWMPTAMERFNRNDGQKCRAIRQEMKRARSLAAKSHDDKERFG